MMSFNPEFFFPEPPTRPEKFPEDYEDNLEEDCLSCGNQLGCHTNSDLLQCALNELRGDNPKG